MIDLTPLDVRKKRGDFKRVLRGYDPEEVDSFIELTAERLEVLVKQNLGLAQRATLLADQVRSQEGREKAIQEALVSAQTLREEISQQAGREAEAMRDHSQREAELATTHAKAQAKQLLEQAEAEVSQIRKQAVGDTELLRSKTESELERLTSELEVFIGDKTGVIDELERKRTRFLRAFRSLLERELDGVSIEEGKAASEDAILELDLTGGQRRVQARLIETAALDLLVDREAAVDEGGETEVAAFVEDDAEPEVVIEPLGADTEPDVVVEPVGVDIDPEETPQETFVMDVEAEAPEIEIGAPFGEDSEGGEDGIPGIGSATSPDTVALGGIDALPTHDDPDALEIPESDGLLMDANFGKLAEDPPEPAYADLAGDDTIESLLDHVLADDDPGDEDVIPVATLAPEDGADALDDDARAVVYQLFDRDDVPMSALPETDGKVEDSWSKVLRGDDDQIDSAEPEASSPDKEAPRGGWAPNFPDKNKQEGATGWSRSRDQSRWR